MTKASKSTFGPSTPVLRNFSAGLIALAEMGPDRLTLTQGAFFLLAGLADRTGRAATFSELRDAVGDTIGRSLHTTYKVFLDEGRWRDGERQRGLGWLTADTDPNDQRRKYLRLTPTGQRIMDAVYASLTMGD